MTKGVNEGKNKQPLVRVEAPINDKAVSYLETRVFDSAAFREKFLRIFEGELKFRTMGRRT